ncbi:TIGR01212 family radical SAM protein [bacterium]|nr:TIGR01212 family radical SAM protein [bacterium]
MEVLVSMPLPEVLPLHFGNKPYFSFKQFLSQRFDFPVHKLCVDAGFTCPNRDGRVGYGGCTYCYNPGFSQAACYNHAPVIGQLPVAVAGFSLRKITQAKACDCQFPLIIEKLPPVSIQEQIQRLKLKSKRKGRFLIYFQPYTNTYKSPEKLKLLYDDALSDSDVVGLCIGTRPDCVDNETLSLIEGYAKNHHVWIEYGLQSIHDHTLKAINRGHTFAQSEDAINRTRGRGIFICVHIILGLPGETRDEMIETIKTLSGMGIHGIKIHHLHVMKNTPLAEEFYQRRVKVFTIEEYIPLVCDVLEYLSPSVTVQRLFGEVTGDDLLIAPRWEKPKNAMLAAIEAEFLRRGSFQGCRYTAAY